VPVVDGNVFRVLSRVFGMEADITTPKAKDLFTKKANELISKDRPDLFNQAMMEFGALQCVPQNPDCSKFVLNSSCLALQKKKVRQLPIKVKTLKITHRYLNYLVVEDEDQKTVVSKRDKKGIWHNLYEFPLIETDNEVVTEYIYEKINETLLIGNKIISITEINENKVLHKLSHQTLHIKFWKILVNGKIANGISYNELIKFPFPIVIYNFIEKHW
jgi:A/G-specific adenine glycosylase